MKWPVVLLCMMCARQATGETLSMRCEHAGRRFEVTFDATHRTVTASGDALGRDLDVYQTQVQRSELTVWALASALGGGKRDVLLAFGHRPWIRRAWANGAVEQISCEP